MKTPKHPQPKKKDEQREFAELIADWSDSPIKFIEDMWGLVPQPLKPQYEDIEIDSLDDIEVSWFEPFVKGKHITWQQWVILLAVELAITNQAPHRIAVRSGHGIGKDATIAFLILWYLLCFEDAQIPCTAPTADQLGDILWKEISVWLHKMPAKYRDLYEWKSEYVVMKAKPETWFARARTGRKENPEALAGVHGEHVFIVVDEASGVDEVVYNTMEGALTGKDILMILIGNPIRLIGYFRDSFYKDAVKFQRLHFDSRESPIVEPTFVREMAEKHGIGSDEYGFRVAGDFPNAEGQDAEGYMPLFTEDMLHFTNDIKMPGSKRLGVDPSGEGADETAWGVRTETKARIVATEQISTPKGIAQRTLTQMDYYGVPDQETTVDNFGVGADVGKEAALLVPSTNLFTINVGEKPVEDADLYVDRRAQAYWRFRMWAQSGGEMVAITGLKEELLSIRYRRDRSGRIEIMSKVKAKKLGFKSPNKADCLMLTFVKTFATITMRGAAKVVRTKAGGKPYMKK